MREATTTYLPWLLSAITIYMTVLAGNKSRHAWLVGLGNQALWLLFIVATGTWGLLPMNFALWVVYGRNHMKWNKPVPVRSFSPDVLKAHAQFGGDLADMQRRYDLASIGAPVRPHSPANKDRAGQ